jgi:hypothetical protein
VVNGRKEKIEKKKKRNCHQSVRPKSPERCSRQQNQDWAFKLPLPSARRSVSETGRLGLGLLRRSLLGGLLELGLASGLTIGTLVLHVLIIDIESLVDLSAEGLFIIKPK